MIGTGGTPEESLNWQGGTNSRNQETPDGGEGAPQEGGCRVGPHRPPANPSALAWPQKL